VGGLTQGEFDELYRHAARPLWAYVYRATGHAPDADDIVQEAFMRLLRANPDGLDGEEARRRYLFRIASNLMNDRWRAARREGDANAVEPETAPVADAAADLRRLFGRLGARDRALLWLAYVEGLSHEEIGRALTLARGSVKVMLSRARGRLRDVLRASDWTEEGTGER
jgi:RNA polymerase sigma-70 factor (ECF subfamily)